MGQPIDDAAASPVIDRTIARVFVLAGVATMVITTSIAYRSLDEVVGYVTHPLTPSLQEADATGLWSANLMLLQVLLLARLPWLERAWGRQVLTRWHRRLGSWSVWLMLVHVLLFVVQRVSHESDRVGPALYRLFVTEPWMWAASLGTAMVLLVVVSSIVGVRRWLRYETWHLLHLWAYVGMALALPHQLVGMELGRGGTGVYWWGLYLFTLAAIVWFRVLVPLHRTRRSTLRVDRVHEEQPGVVSIEVTGRHLDEMGIRPGQFMVWRFLAGRAGLRGHPYSLSSAPTDDRLRVTVSTGGDGGRHAAELRPGTRVAIEGPYGALGHLPRRHPRLLLLAAGVGITPFRALVEGGRVRAGGGGPALPRLRRQADPLRGRAARPVGAARDRRGGRGGPSPRQWLVAARGHRRVRPRGDAAAGAGSARARRGRLRAGQVVSVRASRCDSGRGRRSRRPHRGVRLVMPVHHLRRIGPSACRQRRSRRRE